MEGAIKMKKMKKTLANKIAWHRRMEIKSSVQAGKLYQKVTEYDYESNVTRQDIDFAMEQAKEHKIKALVLMELFKEIFGESVYEYWKKEGKKVYRYGSAGI